MQPGKRRVPKITFSRVDKFKKWFALQPHVLTPKISKCHESEPTRPPKKTKNLQQIRKTASGPTGLLLGAPGRPQVIQMLSNGAGSSKLKFQSRMLSKRNERALFSDSPRSRYKNAIWRDVSLPCPWRLGDPPFPGTDPVCCVWVLLADRCEIKVKSK